MFPDKNRFEWFEGHSRSVIEKCRRMALSVPGFCSNPVTVYLPGGDDKYPSFWIRDAVMECRASFISVAEMKTMLSVILHHQNGSMRRELANGLHIDPWAIPDHINLPGLGIEGFQRAFPPGAVFYPGTYSTTNDQGDGSFGLRPADDDIYETVDLARLISEAESREEAADFLRTVVDGISIIKRLHNGMTAMMVEKETGLHVNSPENWAASNFHDALRPMGFIALTSCLRFRAAKSMARFFEILGDAENAEDYSKISRHIADSIAKHVKREDGWLMVGSEVDRQPDVWSTSMAVYYGLLEGEDVRKACAALFGAYRDGTVEYKGYLRHTPTSEDAVPGQQVWEHEDKTSYGIYQAGGYWPQPLGYYVHAVSSIDKDAAAQMACDYIDHTRSLTVEGAPFEWINPDIPLEETPALGRWYGPSVSLPLEGFRRLSRDATVD